jgi:hypothetical protein
MVRAEERPDEGEALAPVPARADTRAPAPSRKSPWRRRLALAVLAGGVVPGLLLPSVPVALGGALVAALLWPFARRRHAAVAAAGQDEKTPSIVPTADEDHPLWRWQPSYMVAKYRGDGPNSTERV